MVRQKLRVYENTELLICKEQWTEKALAWDLNDANNQAWQSLICLALHISLFCDPWVSIHRIVGLNLLFPVRIRHRQVVEIQVKQSPQIRDPDYLPQV